MKKVIAVILGVVVFVFPFAIDPNKLSDNQRTAFAILIVFALCLLCWTIFLLYGDFVERWRKSEEEE